MYIAQNHLHMKLKFFKLSQTENNWWVFKLLIVIVFHLLQ